MYERGFLKNLFDKKSRKFFTSTPLDAEQIEAAQYPYTKPLIVRAGPGSGKTRVVAERVKDLILEQNIDPDRILCLTFTKAGCEAMQKRLENDEDLKKNNVNFPKKQIRTYHSLCYNLLNLHSNETFNTKKNNDNDQEDEFTDDMKEWETIFKNNFQTFDIKEFGTDKESIVQLMDGVSAFKREDRDENELADYLQRNFNEIENNDYLKKLNDLDKYFKKYNEHLDKISKKDFDDYLQDAVNEVLINDKLKIEIGKYDHVIVDEFQDNNYLQFELVKKYTPTEHVTVVGDRNQSIYSFQGANAEIFSEFKKHYKKNKTIYLRHNYRSTQKIVNIANRLLQKDQKNADISITTNESGKKISIHEFCTPKSEYDFVKNEIVNRLGNKYDERTKKNDVEYNQATTKLSDFKILARTNKIRLDIREYLIRQGIPCRSKQFTTIEYKEKKVSGKLKEFNRTNDLDEDADLKDLLERLKFFLDDEDSFKILYNMVDDFLEKRNNAKIKDFIKYVSTTGKIRKEEFSDIINAVEIKTSHSAKGEEYPFVIVIASQQGQFPLSYKERELRVPPEYLRYQLDKCPKCGNDITYGGKNVLCSNNHDIEEEIHKKEERRLYYVALTRAMYELIITYSKEDREGREQSKSVFLNDLEHDKDEENIIFNSEDCKESDI